MEDVIKDDGIVENNENESVENEETNIQKDEEIETVEDAEKEHDENEKIYTQQDIDLLQQQIDELLQYKPEELSADEIKIQEKLESIWQREVNQTLKEEGLEVFAEFISADIDDTDGLKKQITKLKEIMGTLELSNGYQPSNYTPVDGYSIAKKNKDTVSMIKTKLNF